MSATGHHFQYECHEAEYFILSKYILAGLEIPRLTFKNRASYIYRTGVPLTSRCCILYIFIFNKYKYWVF